jgi:hypothetical protein
MRGARIGAHDDPISKHGYAGDGRERVQHDEDRPMPYATKMENEIHGSEHDGSDQDDDGVPRNGHPRRSDQQEEDHSEARRAEGAVQDGCPFRQRALAEVAQEHVDAEQRTG